MAAAAAASLSPPAVPPSALAGRGPLVRFTVADVQAMLRAGLLPEDASTELLNGCIVRKDRSAFGGDPAVHSPGHRFSVTRLTNLAGAINSPDRHIQIQLPIVCGPDQMPEPDFAIIRGPGTDYADRLPTGADTLCVIEVADSSLERDRNEKLPAYARADVPLYIILNLRNRTAEVYEQPQRVTATYELAGVIESTGTLHLPVADGRQLAMAIADFLPRVS